VKAGWEVKPLGEVCEIYQPKTISGKEMSASGEFVVFGANGPIGRYHQYNHEEPQLLVTCRGATCGAVNISDPFSWITGNAMVVRPKSEKLLLRFTEYFFRGAVDLEGVITGAAQPQITRKSLAPIGIPLPPLEEQKRIVAVLDGAFEGLDRARTHIQTNLQNARELFDEYIETAFQADGETSSVALEEIVDVVSGYSFASGDFNGSNPLKSIKITNVGIREFVEADSAKLPSGFDVEFARFSVPAGSIVIALTRSIIAGGLKVAIVPENFAGALLNQRVAALKCPDDPALRDYLYLFLSSSSVVEYVQKSANTLMQPNLSINDLKRLPIPMPAAQFRNEIIDAARLLSQQSSQLQADYRTKLANLDDLRQSLLQKAFAGELT
jgi:type I restriction enzyme S subunit